MDEIRLEVQAPADEILEFLAAELPTYPLNLLRRLVAHGQVEVDGKRVDHRWAPQPGQTVAVRLPEKPVVRFDPKPMPLDVLYEDAHALAVNKPAGLSAVPDPASLECQLINGLLYYVQHDSPSPCQRIHVVHRLDKETTGVLLVAKDVATARHLCERFELREVLKLYLAVVRGEVAEDEGEVDRALAQHTGGRMRLRERRGKPAQSRYRVLERFRGLTLVQVQPLTGRQHQVRLHMSAIGHPLAVDTLYGGSQAVHLSELKQGYRPKADRPERPLMDRLTLHAQRLELDQADGTRLSVEAPLPADFERLLRALRKFAAKP
jgi:23S rRNA pseudouridine1911/1915/1917 synthase